MIVHCQYQYCGKEIKITDYRYNRGNGRFCSNECRLKAKAKLTANLTCKNCGELFEVSKRKRIENAKCCSRKCAGEYKRKKIKLTCYQCGKIFERKPSDIAKNKTGHLFCSLECYNKYRANEQLSINLMVHHKLTYPLKKKILKRDDYACQICGLTPHDLTVDHIIPVHYFVTRYETVEACLKAGVNNPSNLQTLCWDCNREKGIQIINPAKVMGVDMANINKVKGVS